MSTARAFPQQETQTRTPGTRVTLETKLEIRALSALMPQREIAKKFNVSRPFVSRCNHGYPKFVPPPKPPEQVQASSAVVRITGWMRAAASRRGLEIPAYLHQLAEADAASERANLPAQEPTVPEFKPLKAKPEREKRCSADPAKVQRILFLRGEDILIADIAHRLSIGRSTVQRILDAHAQSSIRVTTSTYGMNQHSRGLGSWDARVRRSAAKIRGEAEAEL